jgi:hypothetical protein
LQTLVHEAVLAPATGAFSNGNRHLDGWRHRGCSRKICRAFARTSDKRSLNSTSASSSSCSPSVKCPSLLRSINSCRRRSVLDGNRRSPTDSIQSTGAAITVFIPTTYETAQGCQSLMGRAQMHVRGDRFERVSAPSTTEPLSRVCEGRSRRAAAT